MPSFFFLLVSSNSFKFVYLCLIYRDLKVSGLFVQSQILFQHFALHTDNDNVGGDITHVHDNQCGRGYYACPWQPMWEGILRMSMTTNVGGDITYVHDNQYGRGYYVCPWQPIWEGILRMSMTTNVGGDITHVHDNQCGRGYYVCPWQHIHWTISFTHFRCLNQSISNISLNIEMARRNDRNDLFVNKII